MVTKVTTDVLNLGSSDPLDRPIMDSIVVEGPLGGGSLDFTIDGTDIGLNNAADGEFNNLTISATGSLTVSPGATITGIDTVPVGTVVMFNAAFATIPANWQLCDGTNGTPNMTDSFVYGTNTQGELLDTGGSADAVVVDHQHGSAGNHNHDITTNTDESGSPPSVIVGGNGGGVPGVGSTVSAGNHQHPSEGVSGVGMNIPPYIKLAFIQRMS